MQPVFQKLFSLFPQIVANVTNCEGTKPYQIVDCVMQLSAEDIVKFTKEVRYQSPFFYSPYYMEVRQRPHFLCVKYLIAFESSSCSGRIYNSFEKVIQNFIFSSTFSSFLQNKQLIFGVVKDGHFLPKQVADLLESHEFNKVPLINGINNHECGWLLPSVSELSK